MDKRVVKVGIDLSTTTIGIAIINEKNRVVSKDFKLLKYCDGNLMKNIGILEEMILEIYIKTNYAPNIIFGIELANFKNPLITQRFSEYCGIIEANIYKKFFLKHNIMIKKFNSQQWQKKIGCANNELREFRKQRAKDFVQKVYKMTILSEDQADAICIAHFLEDLETFQEKKQIIKTKKINVENGKSKKLQIAKSISIRQNKIINLDPIRNKKQIENLKKKIEEFQKEMEKL